MSDEPDSMKRILGAALSIVVAGGGVRSRRHRRAIRRSDGVAADPAAPVRVASPSPGAPLGTVRLALDWTPNTNHTGFYVAAGQRLV